jgi:hypothetical protein
MMRYQEQVFPIDRLRADGSYGGVLQPAGHADLNSGSWDTEIGWPLVEHHWHCCGAAF